MGCELTGCSEPLGLKGGQMQDSQLTSSSVSQTLCMGLLAWTRNRARLDHQAKLSRSWSVHRKRCSAAETGVNPNNLLVTFSLLLCGDVDPCFGPNSTKQAK
ncbi:hypothetical protein J4Q44_G00137040 [Coregonus suidteri]|uniref:Uncharacterized protein n=1 Tax=Coregonus suidteri TaxID=861788 RepID=A0AAN8M0M0_9TELE